MPTTIPPALREAVQNHKAIPVIGAGVSRSAASIPAWTDFLRESVAFLQKHGIQWPTPSIIEEMMGHGAFDSAGELIQREISKISGFSRLLRDNFHQNQVDVNDPLLRAIWGLKAPFLLTTNYDKVLEMSASEYIQSVTWNDTSLLIPALRGDKSVIHLHGVYNIPESVVLGTADYTRLSVEQAYSDFSRSLWMNYHLLFIGTSADGLRDLDFSNLHRWGKAAFPDMPFPHYALVRDGSVSDAIRQELRACNIEVVEYGSDFDDLPKFLNDLSGASPANP